MYDAQAYSVLYESYIKKNVADTSCLYVFAEDDDGLLAAMLEQDSIHAVIVSESVAQKKAYQFVRYVSDFDALEALFDSEYIDYYYNGLISHVSSMGVIDRHVDAVSLNQRLHDFVARKAQKRLLMTNYHEFCRANAHNLPYIRDQFSQCEHYFLGERALMIGAGPSLDHFIPWIKENADNYLMIAVARVAKKLTESGIYPHFYISIDPQTNSFFNSRAVLLCHERSCLIHSAYVNHALLSQWAGNRLCFSDGLPWHLNSGFEGSTVSHAAFDAAVRLGVSSLVMVGVDLCFINDKTHESSSDEARIGKYFVRARPKIKNFKGHWVETKPEFVDGIRELEEMVRVYKQRDPRLSVYNLSPDAAWIQGVELLCEENNSLVKTSNVSERFQSLMTSLSSDLKREKKFVNDKLLEIRDGRKQLSLVVKTVFSAFSLLEKATVDMAKLHNAEVVIDKNINFCYDVLCNLNYLKYRHFENKFKLIQIDHPTVANVVEFYTVKFDFIDTTTQQLLALIDIGINRLNERKMLLDGVGLHKLMNNWLSVGEPGLVYQWQNFFPEKSALPDNKPHVENLKSAFHFLVGEAHSPLVDQYLSIAQDVNALLDQIRASVSDGNTQELALLNEALLSCFDASYADVINMLFQEVGLRLNGHYAAGYALLANLNTDISIINHFIAEERFLLSFYMSDDEKIVASFNLIKEHTSSYHIIYINYLILQKQYEAALSVVSELLEVDINHPVASIKKLELLYLINERASFYALAKWVFTRYPQHPELSKLLLKIDKNWLV